MDKSVAVIFGVNGQDGSYLAELLLDKEYEVVGVIRRASVDNTSERLGHIKSRNFTIVEGDITDASSVSEIIEYHKPDEVYNLAAQSHVATSFKQPAATWVANAVGTQNILESIRKYVPKARFYQASTSEMFGSVVDADGFQRETTELSPNSPYAIAKVAAHHTVRVYREAYGIFACSGILFNHESPRRGEKFVTRKITKYIAKFKEKLEFYKAVCMDDPIIETMHAIGPLLLGNLDAKRDWGFAGDYVEAMWLMLQQDKPDDFVISTGEANSVRDFLNEAFKLIGLEPEDWHRVVAIHPDFIRPYEVPYLCGDSTKAKTVLGWKPKVDFKGLVKLMVENERAK